MRDVSGIKELNEIIKNSEKPVLVDMWASWCGPCKIMLSKLKRMTEESDEFEVVKVSVEDEKNKVEVVPLYGIKSIPSFAIYKNGEKTFQASGSLTEEKLKSELGI